MFERRCFELHAGPWMIETKWMTLAFRAAQARGFVEHATVNADVDSRPAMREDVAIIPIIGPIMKGDSKFGGANSVRLRKMVREAAANASVGRIMLHVDSPGGTVAGTKDLADEVARAAMQKPVHAFIEDLGASAAYWIASQASHVTANKTAEVGSIGTVAIVEDASGALDAAGIKVHVVSTGAYKGAFAEGTEITADQLDYLQKLVDGMNESFLAAVRSGRRGKMTASQLRESADGRVFLADEAKERGLIDSIGNSQDAIDRLQKTRSVPKSADQLKIELTRRRMGLS